MSNIRISFVLLCLVAGEVFGALTTKGCGTTKGCFSDPASCSGSDCKLLVIWKYSPTTKIADFEVQASGTAWVAVGLNNKKKMIGTQGHVCYKTAIKGLDLSAKPPSNADYTVALPAGIRQKMVMVENGKFICTYSRNTTVANAKQRALDQAWYLVMAWGNEFNSTSGIPEYHGMDGRKMKEDSKVTVTAQSFPAYTIPPPSGSPYHSVSVGVMVISFSAIIAQMLI